MNPWIKAGARAILSLLVVVGLTLAFAFLAVYFTGLK